VLDYWMVLPEVSDAMDWRHNLERGGKALRSFPVRSSAYSIAPSSG
jgi:hypothetical protein